MSFATNERANSQPVYYYTFARGARLWRYTDQPADVTIDGVTYRAAVISHSALERSDESAAGDVVVTCAAVTPVVPELDAIGLNGPPIIVTIRQTHRAGVGGVSSPVPVVRFKGSVSARSFKAGACEFRVASLASLFERPILRVIAGPMCNHAVYDRGCGVDPALWTTTGVEITAIVGRTLTVSAGTIPADDYWTAGPVLVETGDAAGERAFVERQVSDQVTLLHVPPPGLAVGDTVAIAKGCRGTMAACIEFNNLDYFLGFPFMPTTNPFDKVT